MIAAAWGTIVNLFFGVTKSPKTYLYIGAAIAAYFGLQQAKDFFFDQKKEALEKVQELTNQLESAKTDIQRVVQISEENSEQFLKFKENLKINDILEDRLSKSEKQSEQYYEETIKIINSLNDQCLPLDMPDDLFNRLPWRQEADPST